MKRHGKFDISFIVELINAPEKSTVLNGFKINTCSGRLQNFAQHGTDCVCCGIKGSHFYIEHHDKNDISCIHLNLYALNENGDEVLMTKDHIVLKSLGGPDDVTNYQPMCIKCNNKRGNSYPDAEEFIRDYRNGTLKSNKKYDEAAIIEFKRQKRERIDNFRASLHSGHISAYWTIKKAEINM